ncbi:MAG: nitroreductase family protein [Chloroflexota bacterium]|nr:MAG: nitroreductase family protein [Chloroflexota bacterium]
MLTVSEAIRQRRSIRSFRSDPIPDEIVLEILEAARLAPSGSNRQPWRFIVVTDGEERAKLRQLCWDQAFIEEAPVVIICCADLTAYTQASRKKRTQEFLEYGVIKTLSGRFADPAVRAALAAAPDPDLQTFTTPAVANAYIAIEHMVLTATALGLGTCWVGALGNPEEIKALFDIPETTLVVAVLPVGYPAVIPPPRPRISIEEILLRPLAVPSK